MIAVDTNILVYAHRADLPWHDTARSRLEALASDAAAWAIPMHCLHEFFATVTRRGPLAEPTPVNVAMDQVAALLACKNVVVLTEDGDHWKVLASLIEHGRVAGRAVHDARIAACCLRHGVSELWTADRDFSRFPALFARNPLVTVNEPRGRYRPRRRTTTMNELTREEREILDAFEAGKLRSLPHARELIAKHQVYARDSVQAGDMPAPGRKKRR